MKNGSARRLFLPYLPLSRQHQVKKVAARPRSLKLPMIGQNEGKPKVPLKEQSFLLDQRTNRNMVISHVDKKYLILQRRREKRIPKYKNKQFQLSLSVNTSIEESNVRSKYKEKNVTPKFSENELDVYAPMWFVIKSKPSCLYGAKHVFETIRLCKYLPDELKTIVYPVIQRNGYFGHPENILISMLWDENSTIRKLSVLRILKIRRIESPVGDITIDIRKFTIPEFNFDATAYYELVDWQNLSYSEPPITKRLFEKHLWQIVEEPQSSAILHIKDYPCHTQAVKRAVKLVTQASSTVCDKIVGMV
ncbi:unnamed protein product [Psylliodes chrysocephalus]|uniref:Uncharacterized protein n=1 Tax=Psylliodes chrysocephalus TaxID=3402493 RepID=A0A9P0CSZ2_9CUCU|nr:unnamed protein product [Psylliodes chrysocephala]